MGAPPGLEGRRTVVRGASARESLFVGVFECLETPTDLIEPCAKSVCFLFEHRRLRLDRDLGHRRHGGQQSGAAAIHPGTPVAQYLLRQPRPPPIAPTAEPAATEEAPRPKPPPAFTKPGSLRKPAQWPSPLPVIGPIPRGPVRSPPGMSHPLLSAQKPSPRSEAPGWVPINYRTSDITIRALHRERHGGNLVDRYGVKPSAFDCGIMSRPPRKRRRLPGPALSWPGRLNLASSSLPEQKAATTSSTHPVTQGITLIPAPSSMIRRGRLNAPANQHVYPKARELSRPESEETITQHDFQPLRPIRAGTHHTQSFSGVEHR